jgi:hypothetical protein
MNESSDRKRMKEEMESLCLAFIYLAEIRGTL